MNAKTSALKKVTDTVGSALSVPYRARQMYRGSKYSQATNTLKTARSYDDAPNFDRNGVTPAFKARVAAELIRGKYKNGVK